MEAIPLVRPGDTALWWCSEGRSTGKRGRHGAPVVVSMNRRGGSRFLLKARYPE